MKAFSMLFVLCLLFWVGFGHGAEAGHSTTQQVGRVKETREFWEAFNKVSTAGVGVEVLEQKAWQKGVNATVLDSVLEDIIAGEKERNEKIIALPVLNVDPDAARYAVQSVKARADLIVALQDLAALHQRVEDTTGTEALSVGLVLNLLNHSGDKEDGILWRALMDEGRQVAENLDTFKAPAADLEAKAEGARDARQLLAGDEMAVRVKLAQRYGLEFPPNSSFPTLANREDSKPDEKGVMASLIGSQIGQWPDIWTFDSPKEFVSFRVTGMTNRTDVLTDYYVRTHVKGIWSGQERDLNLRVTHGWVYTRWTLVHVQELP